MSEFPKQFALPDPLVHINTLSEASIGSTAPGTTPASATWPTANLAIFIPFRVTRPIVVSSLFCYNGTAVSGNIDIGIYSSDGTKIISAGSTAQAGISAIQNINVTSTEIGVGLFYMAIAFSSTSGTIFRLAPFGAPSCAYVGLAQMASAFPLPATATFASCSNAFIPFIGITGRSFV